jgi:hypothetical protein
MSPRPVEVLGEEASLLDLVDNLINRGVVIDGEVTLGVAGVDLVYLRLSAIFCASDRILRRRPRALPKRRAGR